MTLADLPGGRWPGLQNDTDAMDAYRRWIYGVMLD